MMRRKEIIKRITDLTVCVKALEEKVDAISEAMEGHDGEVDKVMEGLSNLMNYSYEQALEEARK